MKIERSQIVDTALLLLNEVGLDRLTTRRLAERLGVQQPALYWHFKNRRALLDAMNAAMLRKHHTYDAPQPGDDWRSFVLGNARSFRRALLSHRDGARVHAGTEAAEDNLEKVEAQLAIVVESGFPMELAIHGLMTVSRFVLGSVLDQQADEQGNDDDTRRDLDEAAKPLMLLSEALVIYRSSSHDAAFEAGLALIVEALEARLVALNIAPPRRPKRTRKVAQ